MYCSSYSRKNFAHSSQFRTFLLASFHVTFLLLKCSLLNFPVFIERPLFLFSVILGCHTFFMSLLLFILYYWIKVREIAEIMNMSKERVCHILNQHLGMRKLSARWVPRLLTVDQKRVRMNISNALLAQFRRKKSEFWPRLITVDETWIHHYTDRKSVV